jgi:asparagine synthase (glutamine-hydrolysing)
MEAIGVQLSGGLDSSMVAASTARMLGDPGALRSYSCVFAGHRWMDDGRFIDALLADVPMRNSRYRPHPTGLLAVILEYLRDWRMPTHGLGWLMDLPVMRGAASDGIGVLLDGHGGDFLFGPAEFLLADLIRGGRLLAATELARRRWPGASPETPWSTTARTVARYALGALPIRAASALDRRTTMPQYVSPRAARVLSDSRDTYDWAKGADAPLWWLWHRHRLTVLDWPSDYLRHHSSWGGVEARSPLYDVELTETVLRMPPEYGFGPRLDRPLAREAVAGLIPEALRLRQRKTRYSYFYRECATGPDLPAIQRLLGGDRLEITPWVRPDYLRGRLSNPPGPLTPGRLDWVRDVTGCLAVECWLRSLSDRSFADDLLADPALSRPGWVSL